MKRTRWTDDKIRDFVSWHEARMKENAYGPEVVKDLRRGRGRFLSGVAPRAEAVPATGTKDKPSMTPSPK